MAMFSTLSLRVSRKSKLTIGEALHGRHHPIWHVLWGWKKETQWVSGGVGVTAGWSCVSQRVPALFSSTTMPDLLTLKTLWTMCLPFTCFGLKTPSRDVRPRTLCRLEQRRWQFNMESGAFPRVVPTDAYFKVRLDDATHVDRLQ